MPLKVNVPPLETSVVARTQASQNPGCTKLSWHSREQNVPYSSVRPLTTREPQLPHFSNIDPPRVRACWSVSHSNCPMSSALDNECFHHNERPFGAIARHSCSALVNDGRQPRSRLRCTMPPPWPSASTGLRRSSSASSPECSDSACGDRRPRIAAHRVRAGAA